MKVNLQTAGVGLLCTMAMTTAIGLGCSSFQGPRYPPPSPPLVDEPAKTIDIGCSTKEVGPRRVEDHR